MNRYAMKTQRSGELVSLGGRVLVHENPYELEFLFLGIQAVRIGRNFDLPTMSVKDHPGLADVRWPLRKEDFRARS